MRQMLITAVVALGVAASAISQERVLLMTGNVANAFGKQLETGYDFNADGVQDFVVTEGSSGPPEGPYVAWIVSGVSGVAIRVAGIGTPLNRLLSAIPVPDLNSDGAPDVLVVRDVMIEIHSGADGSYIATVPPNPFGYVPSRITSYGDLNGDGVPDLVCDNSRVFSGLSLATPMVGGGEKCVAAGDANNDGLPEMAAVSRLTTSAPHTYELSIVDCATALVRGRAQFPDGFTDMANIGDVDGDGCADIAISYSTFNPIYQERLQVYSGRNVAHLGGFWRQPANGGAFGLALAPVGDLDADGHADVMSFSSYPLLSAFTVHDLHQGTELMRASSLSPLGEVYRMYPLPDIDGDSIHEFAVLSAEGISVYRHAVASTLSFGAGCGGSQQPALSVTAPPRFGGQISLRVVGAPPSHLGAVLLGFSNTHWAQFSIPLPFDCTPLGLTGCQLLVSVDGTDFVVADAVGGASVNYTIPDLPVVYGLSVFNQGIFDNPTGSGPVVATNGIASVIGH